MNVPGKYSIKLTLIGFFRIETHIYEVDDCLFSSSNGDSFSIYVFRSLSPGDYLRSLVIKIHVFLYCEVTKLFINKSRMIHGP